MPTCPRCNVPMKPGIALAQTYHARGMTHYPGGPGKVVECWKCPKCGGSESK